MRGASRARDHLTTIARLPRPAGGEAEAAARVHCEHVLREIGFDVRAEPFEYSAFPGRYATSLAGLASIGLLVAAAASATRGSVRDAAAILIVGGVALAAAALWAGRVGVLRLPFARRAGVNLTATRGSAPTIWLVAHLDSKSQPVPILVRAGAIALHAATWMVALTLCLVEAAGGSYAAAWPPVAGTAVVTGLPIVASFVGVRSPGAVDNASGVATVLAAAAIGPGDVPLGIVLTSAEELGLAGARAWVRGRAPAIALNCDGIDDDGELLLMYSGERPARLVELFEGGARADGTRLSVRRLLPGVLVDGVAFADAGWETITLSRGTVRTLARIHTPHDSLARLSGAGADTAASVLARVVGELA